MLNKALRGLHLLEDSVLTLLVVSIVFIGVGQIVLRNAGFSGMIWAETANRVLVLWLAFFGAMRASRFQNHIAIDLMSHYSPPLVQKIIHFIISLFSASVCATAAYYCWRFIEEFVIPDEGTAFLNVPEWLCQIIMPFALAVIALRFLIQSLTPPEPLEHTT